jgi:hypothetical protein
MPPRTTSAYQGILSRPIGYDALGSPRDTRALADKFDALCFCFDVKPQSVDRDLVLVLARRYVPGFQVGKARDPPQKKWDDVGLARLWLACRAARPGFSTDKETLSQICRRGSIRRLTGKVKPVWIQQLLNKARLSPLVQLLESNNPADNKFARRFIAKHSSRI